MQGRKKISILPIILDKSLPRWNSGKEFVYIVGYVGLIPGSERYPGVGYGNSLQYSCLENPMDRVHEVAESDMTEHAYTQSEGKK